MLKITFGETKKVITKALKVESRAHIYYGGNPTDYRLAKSAKGYRIDREDASAEWVGNNALGWNLQQVAGGVWEMAGVTKATGAEAVAQVGEWIARDEAEAYAA